MNFWKFLRPGAVGPFSGHRWRPDAAAWTSAAQARGCLQGVHACRGRDLPYWLTEELWEIELGGEIVESRNKVMAPRGRLVRRVTAWNAEAARDFALACLRRTTEHAVAELQEAGLGAEADRLASRTANATPPMVEEAARTAADAANAAGRRQAAVLCGYVSDSVDCVTVQPVASAAYVAARAANQRSTSLTPDPYLDERTWQSRWLIERLGLFDGPLRE